MAKYKILCVTGLKPDEQRWLQYPQENWKRDVPKFKSTNVGKQTRFKKRGSGQNPP